jgi:hypothetical protein
MRSSGVISPWAWLLSCALAVGASGCVMSSGRLNFYEAKNPDHRPTYLGAPLRTGQIVLTESAGDLAFIFAVVPERFYPFTHAAIVSIEDDTPYVYEVSGEYGIHLKRRVLDNVQGQVHRVPFAQYVAPNLYVEVLDPPAGADPEKIAAYARARFKDGTKFDAYFRYDEHEKLFCTEMLELAIESAGGPQQPLIGVRDNPSLHEALVWLGVPLDTSLPAGLYQDPSRYVASFGQFPTRAAAYAYFEGKREIARRFTKDQRLGFLFELHGSGDVTARPNLQEFMRQAARVTLSMSPPPEPGDPRIAAAVRQVADTMFGAVAD